MKIHALRSLISYSTAFEILCRHDINCMPFKGVRTFNLPMEVLSARLEVNE